ncbi:hypothetical protein MIND_00811300 [Mycena indigotica]|uniref:BTB domain-containing protein n=1 Tax=Mycena indigotica TaxID=2126181 RepID=A0A8H6SGU5_9AGAR|nr:uncharacterized protein MIND_00811300 [Mycena indigotica]KAF7298642.1 hypothetical protein MIND_00811300 [Mycena indigotica]
MKPMATPGESSSSFPPCESLRQASSPQPSNASSQTLESSQLEQDEIYYIPTGDVTICLEGVVFKVHRAIFSRDRDSHSSDTNRQIFNGSAEDFRVFCWAMYALPYEIHLLSRPEHGYPNIPRLLRLAEVAKRHHLLQLRAWALDIVFALCLFQADDKATPCCASCLE